MSTMEQTGDSAAPGAAEQLEIMRLIISCMRAASNIASTAQPTRDLEVAVCRVIALQARRPIQRVLSLWCGWRVTALRKLRAHVGRGDRSATRERLSALEWAVVDVLLLYDMAILSETSYLQQQLEALERTFQVVQQFNLESEGDSSPEQWRRAAECYSCDGVQLSAVALQRRWHELKLDTRQRACVPSANARSMLPIHQAVASSYAHVASGALPSWRELVAAGRVAEPTPVPSPQPEGPLRAPAPAPSEPSSSVSEKSDKTKTIDTTHSKDDKIQDSSKETPVVIVPDRTIARPSNTRQHKYKIKRKHPRKASTAKKSVKAIIKVKPEITEIDEDTPSPKADVVTAMKEIDFTTVDATIVYESEEEDVKTILDVQLGVEKDANINKNSESLEIGVSNDSDINKIAEQSKHKTLTNSKVANNLDDSNILTVQNDLENRIENNTKDLNNTEEPNLNIVITNVWSEKVVNKLDVRKDSVDNVAESRRTSSDTGTISVGSELDYGANYLAIKIAQYLGIWDLTQIDPKLLMEPVISLKRIDQTSLNKPPSLTPQSPTQKPTQTSLKSSYSKLFYERNKGFLKQCAPCEVAVRRVDGVSAGAKRRVQLPDMETVRQHNRGILTAEVAPLVAEVAPLVAEVAPLVAEVAPLVAEVAPLGAEPPKPRQYGPARAKRRRLNTSENQSLESTILVEKAAPLLTPPSSLQNLGSPKKRKPRIKRSRQYEYPFLPIHPSYQSNLEAQNDSPPQNPTCHFEKEKYLNVPSKNFMSKSNQTQDTIHKNLDIQDISTPNISQHIPPQVARQNVSRNMQLPTTQAETNQPSTTITQNSKSIKKEHEDSKEGILNRNLVSEPPALMFQPKQEPVDVELSPIPSSLAIASSAYLDPICTIYSDDYPQMSKTGENDINPSTTSLRAPYPLKQLLNQSAPVLNTSNPELTAAPTILTPLPNLTSQNPSLLESTPIPNAPIALKVKTEPKSRTPSPINIPSIKLEPSTTTPSEFTLKTPKTEPTSRSPSPVLVSLPTLKTEPIPNAPTSTLLLPPAPTSTLSQPPAPTSTLSQPPAPTSTLPQPPAPTSTLLLPLAPTSTLSQPPAPTSTLSQPPAPTSIVSQPPAPTSTLSQPRASTSTLSQPPAPTSIVSQPLAPTSTLSQPPAPTSTLSQPPAPISTLSQPPAPTSTLSQPSAPTSPISQPRAPTLETPTPLKPPSIKTYTKIRSAKKPPIKPCILGLALKQNVKKPVILNLGPTQEPAVPLTPRSEDHLTDEAEIMDAETDLLEDDRELRGNNLPWRAQVEEGFSESDEFDLGMTFAEAYFLYGEPDPVQSMRVNNDWD